MTIDRPSPTNYLDMLEPTSKAWLSHDESYQPIVGDKPAFHAPWPLQCERTPEYRALSDAACHEQSEVSDLGMVLKDLIYHRNGLRASADNYGRKLTGSPAREALLSSAANALRPFISRALAERDEHQKRLEDARAAMQAMRQDERAANPMSPSNVEMSDLLQRGKDEQRAAIERDGCCGGPPMADGFCFGLGMCPREVEVKRCESFCERYLALVEQAANESALADVSARLSVPSSLTGSE